MQDIFQLKVKKPSKACLSQNPYRVRYPWMIHGLGPILRFDRREISISLLELCLCQYARSEAAQLPDKSTTFVSVSDRVNLLVSLVAQNEEI